ncbi:anaerobic ribonucleoside-triphosphate reductase activating protein [Trueperella pyogenes]|uniref:anaerobic ribonucleoside-triphosphate reductase activating protein n=2 Tax=Trueperella pyogenes TaxID=1661 RepID=UPI00345DDB77
MARWPRSMVVRNGDGVAIPAPCEWDGRVLFAGNYADYKPFNFVDGEGVRCSLYVSGCPFKCPECYNRAAQSFRYGRPYTAELEERILADLAQPYVAGLSLVGGEPMLATPILLPLLRSFRERFGAGEAATRDVWLWSGYTYEQILADTPDKRELLDLVDVLVDGPFIRRLYRNDLAFRGSSNQRIIDLSASRRLAASGYVYDAAPVPWRGGEYV